MPQTSISGLFSYRNSVPELEAQSAQNAKGIQNFFNFLTKAYDYKQSRNQANLMEQDEKDKNALIQSIKDDEALLNDLKSRLSSFGG